MCLLRGPTSGAKPDPSHRRAGSLPLVSGGCASRVPVSAEARPFPHILSQRPAQPPRAWLCVQKFPFRSPRRIRKGEPSGGQVTPATHGHARPRPRFEGADQGLEAEVRTRRFTWRPLRVQGRGLQAPVLPGGRCDPAPTAPGPVRVGVLGERGAGAPSPPWSPRCPRVRGSRSHASPASCGSHLFPGPWRGAGWARAGRTSDPRSPNQLHPGPGSEGVDTGPRTRSDAE